MEVDDKIGYRAGTTLALLLLTKDKCYMVNAGNASNAGDSSPILSRNNQALALSNDHKPDLPL